MEEIKEFITLSKLLYDLFVCKDMQMEILRYYKHLKNKQKFIVIHSIDPLMQFNNYYELLPDIPIHKINPINIYKFLFESSEKLKNLRNAPVCFVSRYNKDEIEITFNDGTVALCKTNELMKDIEETGGDLCNEIFWMDYIFNRGSNGWDSVYIAFRSVEL